MRSSQDEENHLRTKSQSESNHNGGVARSTKSKKERHPQIARSSVRTDKDVGDFVGARRIRHRPAAEKVAVIVLGMHRGGTSSVAGTLVKLGAREPKSLMEATQFNERGVFESFALMYLNDEILSSAGSIWHDWRAFNSDWYSSANADEFEERAVVTLVQEFGSARLIVIKDPRMCRMMPFWTKVFERAGYTVRYILPVRSPLEVAQSLGARDGFPIGQGLLLWLRHMLDAEAASRDFPRAILHWPDFLADWRLAMARAGVHLGLIWPRISDRSAAEIDHFLTSRLRNNVVSSADLAAHPDMNDWVREAYGAMIEFDADPISDVARQKLDDIRRKFQQASNIFGRVFVDYEENVERARADAVGARAEHEILIREAADQRLRANSLVREGDAIAAERSALAEQLQTACAQRDKLAGDAAEQRLRADSLVMERDAAAAERTALAEQLRIVCAERDQLAGEATEQRLRADTVVTERDASAAERAALAEQLRTACAERDQLAEEAAEQRLRIDTFSAERDVSAAERTALAEQLKAACIERDQLARAAAEQRKRTDKLFMERNAAAAERDALAEQLAAACAERDQLARVAAEERKRADKLVMERDAEATERATLAEQLTAACAECSQLAGEVVEQRRRADTLIMVRDTLQNRLDASQAEEDRLQKSRAWFRFWPD